MVQKTVAYTNYVGLRFDDYCYGQQCLNIKKVPYQLLKLKKLVYRHASFFICSVRSRTKPWKEKIRVKPGSLLLPSLTIQGVPNYWHVPPHHVLSHSIRLRHVLISSMFMSLLLTGQSFHFLGNSIIFFPQQSYTGQAVFLYATLLQRNK